MRKTVRIEKIDIRAPRQTGAGELAAAIVRRLASQSGSTVPVHIERALTERLAERKEPRHG